MSPPVANGAIGELYRVNSMPRSERGSIASIWGSYGERLGVGATAFGVGLGERVALVVETTVDGIGVRVGSTDGMAVTDTVAIAAGLSAAGVTEQAATSATTMMTAEGRDR
jgi:hypothetical protein